FRQIDGQSARGETLLVNGYLTVNGRLFPKEYEYSVYSQSDPNKVARRFRVTIGAGKYDLNGTLSSPHIAEGGSQITDWRIKGALTYQSKEWRSESELRSDAGLQRVI